MTIHQLINIIVCILASHFVADFLFQTRKMGDGKSKSMYWLSMHLLTYGAVMSVLLAYPLISNLGLKFYLLYILLNFVLHFFTDFVTSKLTSYFYLKSEAVKARKDIEDEVKIKESRKYMKGFWSVIGADQAIHGITLVWTISLLYPF